MRRALTLLTAVGLVVTLVGSVGAATMFRGAVQASYNDDGKLIILAVGSDQGPPHRPGNPLRGRADAIHLLAVNTAAETATVVDIPRDSLIGGSKVNAHLASGGPARLETTLERATGLTIDFRALTTFRGLENMTDAMGGIDIVIDQPMHDPFSGSDFEPGPTTLAGHEALAFTRDRKSVEGGDFARTRHQGDLITAAHGQLRARMRDPATLLRLVASFARNTVTTIPREQLLPLAYLAVQIEPADIKHIALSGAPYYRGGGAVVRLNAGRTFERIRAGRIGP